MEIKIEPKRRCETWSNPASTIQNEREKGKYFWLFDFKNKERKANNQRKSFWVFDLTREEEKE